MRKTGIRVLALCACMSMLFATASASADNEAVTRRNINQAIQDAADHHVAGAEISFPYSENGIYRIYCRVGYLTDIKLHPQEDILFIGAGDTSRWQVETAVYGRGDNKAPHIYLKPLANGLSTNLIVNTTYHSYQILIQSVADWYNPIVTFTYEKERALLRNRTFVDSNFGVSSPDQLNFNYKISGKNYTWTPLTCFDDGRKTYIQLPPIFRAGDAPVLFLKKDKKLSLANMRLKNQYIIVDCLFDEAELRASEKEIVKIKRRGR